MSSPPGPARGPYHRILAATDGSESALRAMQVAVGLAKACGAELLVVHAIPFPVDVEATSTGVIQRGEALGGYYQVARARAQKILDAATELAEASGVPVRRVVLDRPASPVELLLECATQEGADLVVSGTRGLSGFRKLLVGGVSDALVHHAPCSVLVVR